MPLVNNQLTQILSQASCVAFWVLLKSVLYNHHRLTYAQSIMAIECMYRTDMCSQSFDGYDFASVSL